MGTFLAAVENSDQELNELWDRYAHLRKRRKGEPVTQEHKDALVDVVRRFHVNQGAAAALVGLDRQYVAGQTCGDDPAQAAWAQDVHAAGNLGALYWSKMMLLYAADKNAPGQRTAEFMLKALLPDIYREDRGKAAVAGIKVVIQSGPNPGGDVQLEIVDVADEKLLGGGVTP